GLPGLDRSAELHSRIGIVAGKQDLSHAGARAFLDLEDQVYPMIASLDELRVDMGIKSHVVMVEIEDAGDVLLYLRARERPTFLRSHDLLEVFGLEPCVALEGNARDQGIFHDRDHDLTVTMRDAH